MLTAAAGSQSTRDFRLPHHGWGEGSGARNRNQGSLWTCSPPPPLPRTESAARSCLQGPNKKELAASLEQAAVETLALLVARNNGCVLPPSRSPQWAYRSIGVPNELSFLRNHIPNTNWCFYTGVVHSHTDFSCDLPNHVQGDPKMGKRVHPVPGHFRRRPSLSLSHSWLKHYSHMMQITEPPQRTTPQAEMLQVLFGKAILLWQVLRQIRFSRHYPERFLPHQMPPLVWLPSCRQGCSMSHTEELTLISIATQQKFPQTPAFVTLSFLCTQHEARIKAQGLYNAAAW